MATIKQALASSTALTITLASLASSATAGRESTVVDNSSNLYFDAQLTVRIKLTSGTIANDQCVHVYLYASEDGSTYTDNNTGADAAITPASPTNLIYLDKIATPAQSTSYTKTFGGIAQTFGGTLPRKWGVVIRNYSGIALTATAGDHAISYSGVYYTSS